MYAKLFYEGEFLGQILTDHSMSLEEVASLLNIDLDEMQDEDTPMWDYDAFQLEFVSDED